MATLRITHPDILKFIESKASEEVAKYDKKTGVFTLEKVFEKNQMFNISITGTDEEIEPIFTNGEIALRDPVTGELTGTYIDGAALLESVAMHVWDGGDPGMLFIDASNKTNDIMHLTNPLTGEVFGFKIVTNPCGEQWLYAYSVCNLGSMNLTKYYNEGMIDSFDYVSFTKDVKLAIRFLDDVLTVNKFPLPEIRVMSDWLRNIGLGVMGWADLLVMKGVRYDSAYAIDFAEELMEVFKDAADEANRDLYKERGGAPVYADTGILKRFYETTCIAPTGTISMLAGCSSGIEPNFGYIMKKQTTIGDYFMINEALERRVNMYLGSINAELFYSKLSNNGGQFNDLLARSLGYENMEECPFVTTFDVSPSFHLMHQSVFSRYVDNAVSKTINMPESATVEDIKSIYEQAWRMGLKGITVYRDKSRGYQVLNVEKKTDKKKIDWDKFTPAIPIEEPKYWKNTKKSTEKYITHTTDNTSGDPVYPTITAVPAYPDTVFDMKTLSDHMFDVMPLQGQVTYGVVPDYSNIPEGEFGVENICQHINTVYLEGCKQCVDCQTAFC